MHPILWQGFGFALYSYGLLVGLGILSGTGLAYARMKKRFGNADFLIPWMIVVMIAAFFGARALHAVYFPDLFWEDPLRFIFKTGGLVWYGGFFAAFGTFLLLAWRSAYPALALTDALAPGALLGLAFGRIGCFLAGCCFGKPCATEWLAVRYPELAHPTHGLAVHPVQLYESAGALVLLGLTLLIEKKIKGDGLATGLFLAGYGVLRFILEMLRGDTIQVEALSASQWISIGSFIIGLILILLAMRKSPSPE